MAQLYYKYGTMNSGKSFEIIKVAHNYEEQGKRVLIYSPSFSARGTSMLVGSRVGFEREAIPVGRGHRLVRERQVPSVLLGAEAIYCVLVDEAQFLKKHHILDLTRMVDELNIPVMAFGLKNDFQNQLFEGSYNLLIQADKIEEIKTICWYCDRKATMVIRFRDGEPVNSGEQIQIGGNEEYKPSAGAATIKRSAWSTRRSANSAGNGIAGNQEAETPLLFSAPSPNFAWLTAAVTVRRYTEREQVCRKFAVRSAAGDRSAYVSTIT